MPIPVIAAGIAGAASLATVGAAGLGLFGTIAAVGAITSAVGVVTDSKELKMLGGIAGLAGGVGAFAQSQGWLASAGASAGGGGGLGPLGDDIRGFGAEEFASNTEAMIKTPTVGVDVPAPAGDVVASSGGGLMTEGLPDTSVMGGPGQSVIKDALAQPSGGLINAGPSGSLSKAALDGTSSFGANSAPGAFDMAMARPASSTSVFDSLKNLFFDKDGRENKTMLSIAGNMVGGMFDDKKKAETDILKTRAEAEKAQMQNANDIPKLGITNKRNGPIFRPPGPTYYGPQVGLIGAR
jgi:hypothetical protein